MEEGKKGAWHRLLTLIRTRPLWFLGMTICHLLLFGPMVGTCVISLLLGTNSAFSDLAVWDRSTYVRVISSSFIGAFLISIGGMVTTGRKRDQSDETASQV